MMWLCIVLAVSLLQTVVGVAVLLTSGDLTGFWSVGTWTGCICLGRGVLGLLAVGVESLRSYASVANWLLVVLCGFWLVIGTLSFVFPDDHPLPGVEFLIAMSAVTATTSGLNAVAIQHLRGGRRG